MTENSSIVAQLRAQPISAPTVEARVHGVAARLREASLSTPAVPAEVRRLAGQVELMAETARNVKESLKRARNMDEIARLSADLQWANGMAAADQAKLNLVPRMSPSQVKKTMAPIRREVAVELTNLFRLADLLVDALAESSVAATNQTDAEATAVKHFLTHAKAVVQAIGR